MQESRLSVPDTFLFPSKGPKLVVWTLRKGGGSGVGGDASVAVMGASVWADENLVLHKLCFPPDFVAPFSLCCEGGSPFSPPWEGGRHCPLTTSLQRAQQKHATRNRPSSSVNTHFSSPHAGPIYGLVFNPDGTRLATACKDNTIRLWDARHFEKVAELRGHQGYVHAVAFSADGTRLVSCSGDFTVRIWDAPKSANTLTTILGSPPVREALSNR